MIKPYIDLHIHSTISDGLYSPQEVINQAYDKGIRIMAITDHNATIDLSVLRRENPNMQLIQGAEISCIYTAPTGKETELHVIGLGFDPNHPKIQEVLKHNQPDRRPYINAILDRLRLCGIDLGEYQDVHKNNPHSRHIGRVHLAQTMVNKGYVKDVEEAFHTYIGAFGKKLAFVENPLRYVSLDTAVDAILASGGIPVLCHLYYYRLEPAEQDVLLSYFKKITGDKGAMEVFYSRYDPDLRLLLLQKSRQFGLMPSAASDFHGQDENETLDNRFSYVCCSQILDCLGIQVENSVPSFPILVLSGFSGSGKGTILAKFCKENRQIFGRQLGVVTSYTTRKPRFEGENYHFVSPDEFRDMAQSNQFLEFNNEYSDHSYATPIQGVLDAVLARKIPCLEIDRVGTKNLLTRGRVDPNMVFPVFIAVQADELYRRLTARGTETQTQIKKRLAIAIYESINIGLLYPYILINDDLDKTTMQLENVFQFKQCEVDDMFDAEKFRLEAKAILGSI